MVRSLIVLFQPNAVGCGGAKAMVDDELYDKLDARPNVVFAQHVIGIPIGTVSIATRNPAVASADLVSIHLHLSKGVAVNPQYSVDAGLLTAQIIHDVQKMV
jgi:metal-dependent amidase/aminoacylase/carboxypeptidase family protein